MKRLALAPLSLIAFGLVGMAVLLASATPTGASLGIAERVSADSADGRYAPSYSDASDLVRADKTGVPVGGSAQLLDAAASSGRNYVAVAGLAAPALIILILSVSYARRRRRR